MQSQTFGEKIKELRLEIGYSLRYVGEQINYSRKSLSDIETNKRSAPEEIIKPLSDLYRCSYKDLMVKYLSEEVYYRLRTFEAAGEVLEIAQRRLEQEGKGTNMEKSKSMIIETLKSYFSDKAINKAWLFGSFARNTEVSRDSDIDILVSFKKPNKITLFDLVQMKNDLYLKTGREVDLVEEGRELRSFKNQISEDKILIYASKTDRYR